MNIPNFRAYVDNKIYSVVGWNGSFIILSRKFESKYVQSINVKRNDVIIMQGSGIEDRKGNEIFNGDIVRNSDKDIGIVRFKDGAFEVDFKEYIPKAPKVPKIAENSPHNNATTTVLITIIIIRVFSNNSK